MHLPAFSSCGTANAVARNEDGGPQRRRDSNEPPDTARARLFRDDTRRHERCVRRSTHTDDHATTLVAYLLLHQVSRVNLGRHEASLNEGERLSVTAT